MIPRYVFFLGFGAAVAILANSPRYVSAIEVFTFDGNGLDAEATENAAGAGGEITYGFNGTKDDANARYNGYNDGFPAGDAQGDSDDDDRNEFWVLRFDLSGQEKSQIGNTTLKFTSHRDLDPKDLRIWGVNSGTAGVGTLDEATGAYSDVSGLVEDNDMTTISVDSSVTTYLGDFQFPTDDQGNDPLEGDLLRIDQDLIDTSGPNGTSEPGGGGVSVQNTLDGFLRSLGSNEMAMFLVGGVASNGQVRVSSKEAITTDTGLWNCGPSGDFICAPSLEFDIVDIEGVPGDYNGNDVVDAADYTVWRDHLGQDFQLTNENPEDTNPGAVDMNDYTFWVSQFGNTAGGASLSTAAVPEPSTLALALLMLFGSCAVVRRH